MSNDFTPLVTVRDFKEEDRPFIMASTLKGIYYGGFFYSQVPKDIFMAEYKKVLEAMINSPTNVVKVACDKNDADLIRGFSILSGDYSTIHWCFVRAGWRNGGIARLLTPKYPKAYSHLTELGIQLRSKFPDAIFNPFKLL